MGRLVPKTAERAQILGRRCAASGTDADRLALLLRDLVQQGRQTIGETAEKGGFRPGRPFLQRVEELLVHQMAVTGRHRALLDDVVQTPDDAVGRRLPLGQPDQRLDPADEPGPLRQDRTLPGEIRQVPGHHVPEQDGRLVIEVVSRGEHVVPGVERDLVWHVPLGRAAGRTRRAPYRRRLRDGETDIPLQVDLDEPGTPPFRELPGTRAGTVAVTADAETEVYAVRFV